MSDLVGATNRNRTGGSGYTTFIWDNTLIAGARQISHTSPQPVAAPTPIQPLDQRYAVEIITPAAAGPGSLTLEMFELYGAAVWDRLASYYAGAVDIVDIFQRTANTTNPITIVKKISPPYLRGKFMAPYTQEYHNVVITNVQDGETIEVGTMAILKQITVMYTHMTRGGNGTGVTSAAENNPQFSNVSFSDSTSF